MAGARAKVRGDDVDPRIQGAPRERYLGERGYGRPEDFRGYEDYGEVPRYGQGYGGWSRERFEDRDFGERDEGLYGRELRGTHAGRDRRATVATPSGSART